MDHNPYDPPRASTETLVPAEPFEIVPRPISVWLLIVLFAIFGLMYVNITVRFVAAASSHWNSDSALPMGITLFWHLALVSISFGAAYGAFRRHRWSRWLGVAVLAFTMCFMALREDTTEYANGAERAGGFTARILMAALFGWWACAIAFSAKARRYFRKPEPVDA